LIAKAWLKVAASLVEVYLRTVAKTSDIRFCLDNGVAFMPCAEIASLGSELRASAPLLLPFWNAHSLLFISAYLGSPTLRLTAQQFEAVADDSIGGQLTHLLFDRIGLRVRRLSIRSPESRLIDMRGILEQKPSLAMAADSHGPYRTVSTGMARLGLQYSGSVRPVSLTCNRGVFIFPKIRMVLPLPGATILVALGNRLAGQPSVADMRLSLQFALLNLEAKSAGALRTTSIQSRWSKNL
jgi:lysophospholipid acyltransferase (LPLAT)-like uncharacterized protein